MSTDGSDERAHPKQALYERIFVDRAFAEDAREDRQIPEGQEGGER